MLKSIKEELMKRQEEKYLLEEMLEAEQQRLTEKHTIQKQSLIRKIKPVDKFLDKVDASRDSRHMAELEETERQKIEFNRTERKKAFISRNTGKIIACIISLFVLVGFYSADLSKRTMLVAQENYQKAVDSILEEDYVSACSQLKDLDIKDAQALFRYCTLQKNIEKYKGNPISFRDKLSQIQEIKNSDVSAQLTNVLHLTNEAVKIQDAIDEIDTSKSYIDSRATIDNIHDHFSKFTNRYTILINDSKLQSAIVTINNIDNDTSVGRTITAIYNIKSVSLASESEITAIRQAYDKLSASEKSLVVNYADLKNAEAKLETLKTKEAEQNAKLKRREYEKSEQERLIKQIDNRIVYITNSGTSYHCDGCRMLKSIAGSLTIAEAKARGYTSCGICHPDIW